ncbi:MAG: tRNA (adenosine(37)-N6)-threonylcarbamoyltransferase complex dimerization subunit type 1 TsaB, partial [Desulfobulbaceae bacterium]|nr:tRNA (adenosine(37)-N6)-threonylcarbamoyltransferase complex dimerization subunit type 1 TsaB [Candidatus Desulfatifera sulfidica]
RIGMSTIKGLAVAANLPLCGVSTLDALAQNVSGDQLICAVLDARKKEVYCGFYRRDEDGTLRNVAPYRVLAPEQLAAEIQEPVLFVGDGALAYGSLWQELLGPRFMRVSAHQHDPPAAAIGLLAAEQLLLGEIMDVSTVVPLYVRASDAELSLGAKKDLGSKQSC